MPRILLTAFEPWDHWEENSSRLCLEALLPILPSHTESLEIEAHVLPVDFDRVRRALADELPRDWDFALHLGQAGGRAQLEFEARAVNVRGEPGVPSAEVLPLENDGAPFYEPDLPLADWADAVSRQGVPAGVSRDAGTFLCNAALYWSCYLAERDGRPARAAFIHLRLAPAQAAAQPPGTPTLDPAQAARALSQLPLFRA